MSGPNFTRRDFVRIAAAGAGAALLPSIPGCHSSWATKLDPTGESTLAMAWDRVPSILARMNPPRFADREFVITAYGARGDGRTDCTEAFRRAVAACTAAGGGRVAVPEGRFLTGPIHLRSNVNLHVQRDATIAFSQDPRAYLPMVFTRWEGVELMNYSPFIYAFEQQNVAITGEGTLDGQATEANWWAWKDVAGRSGPNQVAARKRLFALAEAGAPVAERVFGEGSYLRPQFIQPYRCRNVLIEGVRIIHSPMWEIHPVLSTNVIVRNVSIVTHGPNNDGCDPESCRDVLIDGCLFDTGDDCIAIKSGRNADGRRLATPTENVIVRNCRMKDGHGGVTIGSEISGGVRWVFAEKCVMDSPNLDRALRFKNNAARGGVLEHVYMRNITVGELADSVLSIDFNYEEGANGNFTPVVRDVEMRDVTSRKSNYGIYVRALERSTIENVRLVNCRFDGVAKGNVAEHVKDLSLRNVRINGQEATLASIIAAPAK
jgi:polygalacturonase